MLRSDDRIKYCKDVNKVCHFGAVQKVKINCHFESGGSLMRNLSLRQFTT